MVVAALEDWALFFHLLGAFLLVAGVIVAGVAFEAARARHRASEIALLLGLTRVGVALVGIGSALILPFGLWLVHIEHVGYGAGWVDTAFALFVVVGALGGAGGQVPKRARKVALELGGSDGESVELRALLDDHGARALNYSSALLLLVIVVLMVFKPGGPA